LNRDDIDYLIICTQSPDHLLPSTACIVHENLKLSKWIGAIDINQGCSGYVFSLGVAKALIETKQARNVLLVTADTYSKHLNPIDHATRTIFGDAAAATFINKNSNLNSFGQFVYGTDGSGAKNLVSYKGGLKQDTSESKYLYMNGPEIFHFTLNAVPSMLEKLFQKNNTNIDEVDYFIFHQANKFMLDSLQKKLAIPEDKFLIFMSEHGNTVSSSIPITISENIKNGKIKKGHKLALVGFGVGYSYSATIITV
jgi:3-oxoacyl-[acyl-carrier-protein] synthase-3